MMVKSNVTLREGMPLGKETPLEIIQKIGKDGLSGGIGDVCLYPTFKCNLNCYMCLVNHFKNQDVPSMSLTQLRDALKNENVKTLFYLGGEPFITPNFMKMLEYYDAKGINQIISTNGMNVTESYAQKLASLEHLMCIQVSLNGTKEIDNKIRGSPKSYERAVKSIKTLKEAGLPVWIHCVILNENINDLANVVKLGAELGVASVNFIFSHAITEEEKKATKEILKKWIGEEVNVEGYVGELSYSEEQLINSINAAKEEGKKHNLQVMFFSKFFGDHPEIYYRGTLLEQEIPICQLTLMPPLTPAVGPDGSVYNCPYLAKSFGNIQETSLEKIWDSEPLRTLRKEMINGKLLPICKRCPCSDVININAKEGGGLSSKDEWTAYLTQLTEELNKIPEVRSILGKISPTVFQYHISDHPDLNYWHSFEKEGVRLGLGENEEENTAKLTHTTDFETLKNVNAGKNNPVQATMEGTWVVEGDMKKLMDLAPILPLTVKAHDNAVKHGNIKICGHDPDV